ncbi:DUF5107 domain-containing protein [Nocardioides sp. NBC_00850]|uniref:DUF5107 domain-containing protein n=1 Tax=Nocardioides sp. NBC_00850 TaxID=2976001 RepID=UPI00386BCB7E|nr:DUF5107 domain-containing protein [Nocardioides sp. NBC_00850]
MSTLRMDRLSIEGAEDPIDGPLPLLHDVPRPAFESGAAPYPDMAANLEYGRPSTLLPYTAQDSYTRRREVRDLPSLVLENELLSATFLPGYGGRLWSLVHRPSGRELLHRNPVLQPANLALRDAWVAGGVEWNLGATGHWPLTCSPLHAVRLTAQDGTPVLRMYELERMRRVVVTIDAWLPAGSPVLLVHVSLQNPAPKPTPVYWWTNIAVPQGPDVRVVAPAERAFHFDYAEQLRLIDFPDTSGGDQSYPTRFARAADFFMDIPDGERRWIAALDGDGRGLVQASTDRLVGRKLFQWGTGAGGQRWQEWLSGPGAAYIEIQAGLARTQFEHLALPAGETWEWAEAFGLLEVDPERVHGSWDSARAAVDEGLEMLVPRAELEDALSVAGQFAGPADLLARGSGWGALEVAAGAVPADPLRPFGACSEDQKPWLDLLQHGRLPISDPPAVPVLGAHWRELLEASADDWHAWYHLGLLLLADDDRLGAHRVLERSIADHPNPWALHALAHLADSADLADSPAADLLLEAHRLRPDLRELTIELLQALIASDRPSEALEVIAALADRERDHGRIRLCTAQAALAVGDLDRVRRLLDAGITVDNLREGETALDTLWLAVHPGEPVPPAYDFRMSSD